MSTIGMATHAEVSIPNQGQMPPSATDSSQQAFSHQLEDGNREEQPPETGKRRKQNPSQTFVLRSPQWTYFKLRLAALQDDSTMQNHAEGIDILTLRQNLSSALTQFLGLTGSAITIDILCFYSAPGMTTNSTPTDEADALAKHGIRAGGSNEKSHLEAVIRTPREDSGAVQEAISGWTGGNARGWRWKWIVIARDEWLVRLSAGTGAFLFET